MVLMKICSSKSKWQEPPENRKMKKAGQKMKASWYLKVILYSKVADTGTVTGIFHNKMPLPSLKEGDIGIVVLNNTPFYAESGGQASDKGFIYNDDFKAEVLEVVKIQKAIGHKIKVQKGELLVNSQVTAMI